MYDDLVEFLQESVTPFHAAATAESWLRAAGFTRLEEADYWNLDHGADDYLCKPFGIMEFISRVKAVLRRAGAAAPAPAASTMHFGEIVLDDMARTVRVGGAPVELTFKEYALLHLFLEHPEEVLARERIMKDVWDTDDLLESRTIDMHVRTLRQKLGAAGEAIRTVRKVGYKLSTEGSDD